jgi:hypothetical protein
MSAEAYSIVVIAVSVVSAAVIFCDLLARVFERGASAVRARSQRGTSISTTTKRGENHADF